jgi:hypothetical protein
MPGESLSTANYAAVINDLRAKRDDIDRTIAMLEARVLEIDPLARATARPVSSQQPLVAARQRTRPMPHGATGIGEACAKVLKDHEGSTLTTREVFDLVQQSGFVVNTANPMNNVWSALKHRTKSARDVQRVGKNWRYALRREKPASAPTEVAHVNGYDNNS